MENRFFIAQVPVPPVGQLAGFPAPMPGLQLVAVTPYSVPPVKTSSLVVPGAQDNQAPGTVVCVFMAVGDVQPLLAPDQSGIGGDKA